MILVRHGETEWNKLGRCQGISDVPLNSTGEKQARDLADSLKNENISAIISSDLQRALHTAKSISEHHSIEVQIDERFREMDQGDFEGLDFKYIRENYSDVLKKWREEPEVLRIPGGESLTELQERAWLAFNNLQIKYKGKNVLVVTHNLTIITLLCKFTGKSLKSFREFMVHETSKTVIDCNEEEYKIEILNDLSHII
ncbi:MAG: histidine phosphatase family protein [Thermodesulfobacteriota bacterium]